MKNKKKEIESLSDEAVNILRLMDRIIVTGDDATKEIEAATVLLRSIIYDIREVNRQ